MSNQKEKEILFAYLEAVDNDDLPDGAWWQSLEDGVSEFNNVKGTDFDPNDMVHEYIGRK